MGNLLAEALGLPQVLLDKLRRGLPHESGVLTKSCYNVFADELVNAPPAYR